MFDLLNFIQSGKKEFSIWGCQFKRDTLILDSYKVFYGDHKIGEIILSEDSGEPECLILNWNFKDFKDFKDPKDSYEPKESQNSKDSGNPIRLSQMEMVIKSIRDEIWDKKRSQYLEKLTNKLDTSNMAVEVNRKSLYIECVTNGVKFSVNSSPEREIFKIKDCEYVGFDFFMRELEMKLNSGFSRSSGDPQEIQKSGYPEIRRSILDQIKEKYGDHLRETAYVGQYRLLSKCGNFVGFLKGSDLQESVKYFLGDGEVRTFRALQEFEDFYNTNYGSLWDLDELRSIEMDYLEVRFPAVIEYCEDSYFLRNFDGYRIAELIWDHGKIKMVEKGRLLNEFRDFLEFVKFVESHLYLMKDFQNF